MLHGADRSSRLPASSSAYPIQQLAPGLTRLQVQSPRDANEPTQVEEDEIRQ